tara:strand:- start:316 stop:597 length:282 start_codon:yes stop_codon:yes gene_type:complete
MAHFNLVTPITMKNGSTYWHKVGAMFEGKNDGFNIVLNSIPAPSQDGDALSYRIMAFPNKEDGGKKSYQSESRPKGRSASSIVKDDLDDEVPF